MAKVSIFGKGNMGTVIGDNFKDVGNEVAYVSKEEVTNDLGEIVVLAVPYAAVDGIVDTYKDSFAGKLIVDITNPVNFETFDDLVVPSDSSAAAVIAEALPDASVVKAFNTNFAASLGSKKVADAQQTTVLLASDDEEAKSSLTQALDGSGLAVIDAGSLKRARELEAVGFLQISLAATEKITWTGGFGVFS